MDHSQAQSKNVEHVAFARLARDSGFELMLTFVLFCGVVSIVRWVIGPSPISRAIPGIHAELWIVGATIRLLLAGLILSPSGRASGVRESSHFAGYVAFRCFHLAPASVRSSVALAHNHKHVSADCGVAAGALAASAGLSSR